jgi:hypothetical protein
MLTAADAVERIQNTKLILMAVRELVGEVVFTLAAFYGLYQTFLRLIATQP